MIAIHLDQVSVTYIAQPVFQQLSWEIHDNRVVGLVGPNGAGKSTLLRLVQGQLSSDTGYVNRQPGVSVGYLPQEPNLDAAKTVWAEALTASAELTAVNHALNRVETQLGDPAVYNNEEKLNRVLAEQERLLAQYAELGGAAYEGRVRSTLIQLGFETELERNLPITALSGGQKKLVGLAKLLITQPKILLLDEPDNHLDLRGKELLEGLIRSYDGGVVIISHDRYLLDLVVDEIAELALGRLTIFKGDYSEYAFEKQAGLLRQQQMFKAQNKEITRLEQAAKRLLIWGRTYDNEKLIKRGKAILGRLEKIERIEKPILEQRRMDLALAGWRGSNKVMELTDVDKVFPAQYQDGGVMQAENLVLAGLKLLLWHGERVGLVGPNGAGKSVLFRLLLGEEAPTGGTITIGPSVRIGYYAQEHESLDYNTTLIETVRNAAHFSESNAVSFLGKFLFNYEQARGPVSALSGGERSRLQMALLTLTNANFLLLDEPTNNLDIASSEVLEDALGEFEGTLLVISHDRYFLDRVVDRIVELDNGTLTEFIGNFSDYQAAKQR